MMKYKKIIFHKFPSIDYKAIASVRRFSMLEYNKIPFYLSYNKIPKYIKTPYINIFEQIILSEPEHSKILSNLLNPLGTHGYKNIILKSFLDVFCPELDFNEKEHWTVTAEKERYDIRIKNSDNSKIIIVENKSNNAVDQPNQLYRYWFNGIFLAQYNRKIFGLDCYSKIIYLSPSDYKQPEEQSKTRPIDWDINLDEKIPCGLLDIKFFNIHIIDWLNKCLLYIDKYSNLYYYIIQYRDYWR